MTFTICYTTGTLLVQDNECPRWRGEEFNTLTSCTAISAFVGRGRSRGCKLATSALCNLRLPIVVPSPAGKPGRRDIKAKRSTRAQLPRTTGKRGAGVDFRPSVPSQSFRRQSQSQSQSQPPSQTNQPINQVRGVGKTPRHTYYHRDSLSPSLPRHSYITSLITELETAKQQTKAELKQLDKVQSDH